MGPTLSLSLAELPWFNPVPLTLTSSLRYLAVLLPHLSDSTQVLISKHQGCSPHNRSGFY